MNPHKIRQLLQSRGLAPHKYLGQNFLVQTHIAERIVSLADLKADDTVLEVGVGLGALTRPLAAAAGRVIGIETDAGIIRLHEEQHSLPANVRLVHADILEVDLAALAPAGKRFTIVANLPYSISTPFLFLLMEQRHLVHAAVLMLQKEFARRLAAEPGRREYGAPSVLLAACAEVKPVLAVGPEAFHPRPRVDSLVLRLRFEPEPKRLAPLGPFDRPLFTRLVRAAFGQRRKTLLNGLRPLITEKKVLEHALQKAGIAAQARAESLSLEDFIRLTQNLQGEYGTSP